MIKIGIVQFAPKLGDVEANIYQVRELINNRKRCDLYVLPELSNSGYRFKHRDEAVLCSERITNSRFLNFLMSVAEEKNAHIVSGFCERDGDILYNSSVLMGPEGLIGVYRKLHLFLDEKEIFEPGDLGLPVFNTPIGKIGMQVCFDWMFPESWRVLAIKGAQIIAHPSNLVLPFCQGVIPSYALINKCFIATANRIGSERDLTFTGQSILASPKGEVLLKATKSESSLLKQEIEPHEAENKMITPYNHAFKDRRNDVYGNLNLD